MTTAPSEKADKQSANRRLLRKTKEVLGQDHSAAVSCLLLNFANALLERFSHLFPGRTSLFSTQLADYLNKSFELTLWPREHAC